MKQSKYQQSELKSKNCSYSKAILKELDLEASMIAKKYRKYEQCQPKSADKINKLYDKVIDLVTQLINQRFQANIASDIINILHSIVFWMPEELEVECLKDQSPYTYKINIHKKLHKEFEQFKSEKIKLNEEIKAVNERMEKMNTVFTEKINKQELKYLNTMIRLKRQNCHANIRNDSTLKPLKTERNSYTNQNPKKNTNIKQSFMISDHTQRQ